MSRNSLTVTYAADALAKFIPDPRSHLSLSLLIATAAAIPTIITQLSMLETPCVAISLSAAA